MSAISHGCVTPRPPKQEPRKVTPRELWSRPLDKTPQREHAHAVVVAAFALMAAREQFRQTLEKADRDALFEAVRVLRRVMPEWEVSL